MTIRIGDFVPPTTKPRERWHAFFRLDDDTFMPLGDVEGEYAPALNDMLMKLEDRIVLKPTDDI